MLARVVFMPEPAGHQWYCMSKLALTGLPCGRTSQFSVIRLSVSIIDITCYMLDISMLLLTTVVIHDSCGNP